jgi:predicted metal-dependent peptidase
MRRDRRQPFAEHLKGRTKDRIYNLAVVGDESGSVSDGELSQAIAEVSNICKLTQTPIWYVPVDTQAYAPQRLTSTQRSFKRSACGGTTLSPAIQQLKDSRIQANAIVVITDGYIDQSDIKAYQALNIPIIWLITSEGTIPDGIVKPMRAFKLKPPKHA